MSKMKWNRPQHARNGLDYQAPHYERKAKGTLARARHKEPSQHGLTIYTDGACDPNPGAGGWAFVVYRDGVEIHAESGGEAEATNNIMELLAILNALIWVERRDRTERVIIYSDSQYAVKGTTIWCDGWVKRGWRKAGGAPVMNLGLWKEIHPRFKRLPVGLQWVRGHDGVAGNERADRLSVEGRRSASFSPPAGWSEK